MPRIFHIAIRAVWDEAQNRGTYMADSLSSEGFIHCSRSHQIIEVANRLFRSRKDLIVLHLDTDKLNREIRYENLEGGTELYPHIYGDIRLEAVTGQTVIGPSADGDFDQYRSTFEGSDC